MKQQPRRGPVASRLGLKVKVANNLSFDARQKIKQKQQQQQQPQQQPNKPSVKVRIGNPNFQDARQKIMQKTKFLDARERIRNKKPDNTKAGGNSQPGDMRIKINNAKAKKIPVAINRNAANQGQGATQVTVTGQGRLLTKPGGGVQAVNGSLVKVITQSQETPPVKFKGQLKSPEERQNRFQAKSAPAAIRVTKSFDEISSTPASSLPGGGGVIRVRNEFFQPQPAPVYQAPQPRTMYHHQHMEPGMEAPAASYVPQILPEHFDMAPPVHQAPAQYHSQAEMPMFRKTVQNTAPAPAPAPVAQPAPLKLRPAVSEPVSSTTQGVRVVITNLHPVVTEDDVVELFSVAGELKRARLLRPGTAEVVYGAREHALSAVRKYHHRELDGVPMTVQIVSAPPPPRKVPVAARLEASPSPPPPAPAPAPVRQQQPQPQQPRPQSQSPTEEFQPLKLFKGPAKGAPATKSNIDVTAVHKALFKTKEPGPVKPVTFTVKI